MASNGLQPEDDVCVCVFQHMGTSTRLRNTHILGYIQRGLMWIVWIVVDSQSCSELMGGSINSWHVQ